MSPESDSNKFRNSRTLFPRALLMVHACLIASTDRFVLHQHLETVEPFACMHLKITRFSSMEEKGQAQLLASWLNFVSAQLGVDVKADLSSIFGWETAIVDDDMMYAYRKNM